VENIKKSSAESLSNFVEMTRQIFKMIGQAEKMIDADGLSRLKSFRQFGISCPND